MFQRPFPVDPEIAGFEGDLPDKRVNQAEEPEPREPGDAQPLPGGGRRPLRRHRIRPGRDRLGHQPLDRLLGIDQVELLHRSDDAHRLAPGLVALVGIDPDAAGWPHRVAHR